MTAHPPTTRCVVPCPACGASVRLAVRRLEVEVGDVMVTPDGLELPLSLTAELHVSGAHACPGPLAEPDPADLTPADPGVPGEGWDGEVWRDRDGNVPSCGNTDPHPLHLYGWRDYAGLIGCPGVAG